MVIGGLVIEACGVWARRRALCLRIKVSGATTGAVKLKTRVPAEFLNGLAAFIPLDELPIHSPGAALCMYRALQLLREGVWQPGDILCPAQTQVCENYGMV